MKHKKWIIFFGEDWHGLNSTAMFLARELAKTHNILWFNSIGLREPRPTLYDLKRAIGKVTRFVKPNKSSSTSDEKTDVPENIHLANPIAIPYYRFSFVRKINYLIIKKLILKHCAELNIKDPVFISANPATADIMDIPKPSKKVYYCADEYSVMPFVPQKVVQKLENDLLDSVDLVFTTSKALAELKQQQHDNVHYLPHGVRYEHMFSSVKSKTKPEDLQAFTKPLIGYVGLIGQHLDLEIVKEAAFKSPEYDFIFIGPIEDDTKPPKLDNIHYLGPKAYQDVPAYLGSFTVALLPWNDGVRNKYAHPTKIREYLAAGLCTVGTSHPEIMGLSDQVLVANDAETFASNIKTAVQNYSSEKRLQLAQDMNIHDWSYRAKEIEEHLNA